MGIGEESTWQTSGIEDATSKRATTIIVFALSALNDGGHCKPRLDRGFTKHSLILALDALSREDGYLFRSWEV